MINNASLTKQNAHSSSTQKKRRENNKPDNSNNSSTSKMKSSYDCKKPTQIKRYAFTKHSENSFVAKSNLPQPHMQDSNSHKL